MANLPLSCSVGWLTSTAGADPVVQSARAQAQELYKTIAASYGAEPERWASANGAADAVGRVAVPYSLKQLNGWLSRGGMALGAPRSWCSQLGPAEQSLQTHWLQACLLTAGRSVPQACCT